MKLNEHMNTLGLTALTMPETEPDVSQGYTSDLLSDVMANAQEGCALITIQAHKNTVAVATLVGASAIVICNNRNIPEDMIQACQQEGLSLYGCKENQFTFSGKLYGLLNKSPESRT